MHLSAYVRQFSMKSPVHRLFLVFYLLSQVKQSQCCEKDIIKGACMHNCMHIYIYTHHSYSLFEAKFTVRDFNYQNDLVKTFSEDALTLLIPCLSKDIARSG